jgi:acylglycerol lipase
MKHHEGYFKSIRDTNIYYQYWLPEGEPKAILLVAHGIAEHSGRYMNVVNHLVPAGYAVYGIDHIGHGKSDGKRVCV